jgi:hypothetical protein
MRTYLASFEPMLMRFGVSPTLLSFSQLGMSLLTGVAYANGCVFLGGWWIAGPYPDASEPDTTHGPAHPVLAADAGGTREMPWRFLADSDIEPAGFVQDFRQTRNASAYAMTFPFSTRERDVTLLVTCDPSARLWLNGRLIREVEHDDRFAAVSHWADASALASSEKNSTGLRDQLVVPSTSYSEPQTRCSIHQVCAYGAPGQSGFPC